MPVVFDAAASVASAVASYSYTHTPVGTPTTAIVGVNVAGAGTTVTGVTYGGTAMVRVRQPFEVAVVRTAVFILDSPASGAQSVAVTLAAAAESVTISCTVTGAGTGQPTFSNDFTIAASANPVSCYCASDGTGDLVLGFIHSERDNADANITPGASQTQRQSLSAPTLNRPHCELTTQAGAVNGAEASWTLTTVARGVAVVTLNIGTGTGGFGASLVGIAGTVSDPWNG